MLFGTIFGNKGVFALFVAKSDLILAPFLATGSNRKTSNKKRRLIRDASGNQFLKASY